MGEYEIIAYDLGPPTPLPPLPTFSPLHDDGMSSNEDDRPSYHDLHITTAQIPRTSIFNLPYGLQVTCCRVAGWELWQHLDTPGLHSGALIAGEYDGPGKWLVLDVAGHVIVDGRGA